MLLIDDIFDQFRLVNGNTSDNSLNKDMDNVAVQLAKSFGDDANSVLTADGSSSLPHNHVNRIIAADVPNSDGVVDFDTNISENSVAFEDRVPAFALLYKFQRGFTIEENPLIMDHEDYCEDFNTLINSEILEISENQIGAVILWGSFNATSESKQTTWKEVSEFMAEDPLQLMIEEFELVDLSPQIPIEIRNFSATRTVPLPINRLRHAGDLYEDSYE